MGINAFDAQGKVFPACAGMFLTDRDDVTYKRGFPRVRGDVPNDVSISFHFIGFSPRARGCSAGLRFCKSICTVFPACAGMFPSRRLTLLREDSFPRVRGDVPFWCL